MAITGIVGARGSGKTLLMTAMLGREKRLRNRQIITNYGCAYRDSVLDAERLVEMGNDLQNCCLAVDEIHVLIDSRRSGSSRNVMVSYFILQTRKRGVEFLYTTQHEGQVDIRLRRSTDNWVFCERIGKTPYFSYKLYERLGGPLVSKFVLDGRKVFGAYDTTEAITDF